jgi:hypothetical protein
MILAVLQKTTVYQQYPELFCILSLSNIFLVYHIYITKKSTIMKYKQLAQTLISICPYLHLLLAPIHMNAGIQN